ncbi:hypothetical protein ASZ78_010933 [Callipepla squamata]|uniref:Dynamin-binding protein n=1 Tax=Callipepla squamata TaxID=9009 RepID=A0A226NI51_CALSU|nr:hypothetical protein ASZ78_010933 [Callipepla squamata]
MEAGSVVRAVFDFCPSVSEELPLFVGDVIEVLEVVDEFWLLGKKEGVTGQFPSSFVESVDIPLLKQGEKLFVCTSDFTSQEPGSLSLQRGDLVVLGGNLASSWLQGRSSWGSKGFFPSSCVRELCLSVRSRQLSHSSLLEVPAYSLGQARALMGLSAQLEEELDFREGDVINIIGIPEPGWFEGELRGHRGIFPEGFVELLTPLRAAGTSEDQEPAGTCDTNGTVPTRQEEDVREDKGQEPGSTYGVALYQFQALESEELDFDVGDRIRIVGILDDGWLEGELRGKRGIFPHRFVRLEASDPCREKMGVGDPQAGGSCEVTIHQDSENTCSKVLPLPGKDSWDKEDGLVAHPEPDTVVSHMAGGSEAPLGTDLRQCQAFPNTELQEPHPKATADTLPFKCAKTVNGLLTSTQLSSEQSSKPGQAGPLEPPALPEHDGGRPTMPSQAPCSQPNTCGSQAISPPNSCAASEPQENQSSIQDLDGCVDDQQKSKPCSSSWGGVPMGLDTWSGSWGECSSLAAQGDSGTDLDSKLTEQLVQFEKSLSSTSAEQDKVSRHFSILDYSSEKDIVCGSPKCVPHAKLPERRKALRPPPPRPSTLATTPIPKGRSLSFSVKPSRPAPRPPSSIQRRSMVPSQLQPNLAEQRVEESHEDATQTGSASPCSILLMRIGEVERDLEAYRKTRAELSLLLKEQQDELVRAETLENLDFCDSNIESLSAELQELRGDSSTSLRSDPCCRQSGIQDTDCNGRGEPEGAEHSRVRTGRPDWSHIWEQEAKKESRTDSSLQRNSLYRRTAPSTLRHSEFVQTRKEKQELGQMSLDDVILLVFLAEMTLLSSQTPSLETSSSATESPEHRMLEKRSKVIEELLQTERDYIRDLEMCVERIMVPLQQAQVLNVDFEGLFGNIQVVISFSKQLLSTLESSNSIGSVFLAQRAELESVYRVYCQNHDEAIALLETYEKDEKIQKLLVDLLDSLRLELLTVPATKLG